MDSRTFLRAPCHHHHGDNYENVYDRDYIPLLTTTVL